MNFKFKRGGVWVVAFAFFVNAIGTPLEAISAGSPPKDLSAVISRSIDPTFASVPSSIGEAHHRFTGSSGMLVIHLQDAHQNFQAQSNLAALIQHVSKVYPVGLIGVEGYEGEMDLSLFRAFPDDPAKKDLLLGEMRKGRITGPEFAVMTGAGRGDELFGLEDTSIYLANLKSYLEASDIREKYAESLDYLRQMMENLKTRAYPKPFRDLEAHKDRFSGGELDLKSYYLFLDRLARDQGVPIQKGKALQELDRLIFQEKKGFPVSKTTTPVGAMSQEIFGGLRQLEDELSVGLLKTEEARGLDLYSEYFGLFRSLFDLKLTPEEYVRLRDLGRRVRFDELLSFLKAQLKKYHMDTKGLEEIREGDLKSALDGLSRFYDLAGKRDEILARHLTERMKGDHIPVAILVTGGYHTDGILSRLATAGISYVSISPTITSFPQDNSYEDTMRRSSRYFAPSMLSPPDKLFPIFRDGFDNRADTAKYRERLIHSLIRISGPVPANARWRKGVIFESGGSLYYGTYPRIEAELVSGRSLGGGLQKILLDSFAQSPELATPETLEDVLKNLGDSTEENRLSVVKGLKVFLKFNPEAFTEGNLGRVLPYLSDPSGEIRRDTLEAIPYFQQANPQAFSENNLRLLLEGYIDRYAAPEFGLFRSDLYSFTDQDLQALSIFKAANPQAFSEANLRLVLDHLISREYRFRAHTLPVLSAFLTANPGAFTESNLNWVLEDISINWFNGVWRSWKARVAEFLKFIYPSFPSFFDLFRRIYGLFFPESAATVQDMFPKIEPEFFSKDLITVFAEANPSLFVSEERRHFISRYFDQFLQGMSLKELVKQEVEIPATVNRRGEKKTASVTTGDPAYLAGEWMAAVKMDQPSSALLHIVVNFSTGERYRDRGRWIALAYDLALSDAKTAADFWKVPLLAPDKVWANFQRARTSQSRELRDRISYRWDIASKYSEEPSFMTELFSSLEALNLGLLLATTEDEARGILGQTGYSFRDRHKTDIAKVYRLFEADLIQRLKQYDQKEGISVPSDGALPSKSVSGQLISDVRALTSLRSREIRSLMAGRGLKAVLDSDDYERAMNLTNPKEIEMGEPQAPLTAGKSLGADVLTQALSEAALSKHSALTEDLKQAFGFKSDKGVQVFTAKGILELSSWKKKGVAAEPFIRAALNKKAPLVILYETNDVAGSLMAMAVGMGFSKDQIHAVVFRPEMIDFKYLYGQLSQETKIKDPSEIKMFLATSGTLDQAFRFLSSNVPLEYRSYFYFEPLGEIESLLDSLIQLSRVQQLVSTAA